MKLIQEDLEASFQRAMQAHPQMLYRVWDVSAKFFGIHTLRMRQNLPQAWTHLHEVVPRFPDMGWCSRLQFLWCLQSTSFWTFKDMFVHGSKTNKTLHNATEHIWVLLISCNGRFYGSPCWSLWLLLSRPLPSPRPRWASCFNQPPEPWHPTNIGNKDHNQFASICSNYY